MEASDLSDLLVGLSEETPSRKRFIAGPITVSYGDYRSRVARTRHLFIDRHVGHGDRVVIATGDDLATASLYAACLLEGATAVVIDPAASVAEATVLVTRARPSLIFADADLVDAAEPLRRSDTAPIIPVVSAAPQRTSFGLLRRRPQPTVTETYPAMVEELALRTDSISIPDDAVALILFTSGTTAGAKGVEITRSNLAAQLRTFRRHYGYDEDSVIVNHLPMHHSDGLNQGPLLTLAVAGTLVRPGAVSMQSLGSMMDTIYREKATHLITVPTVLAMMQRLSTEYDDILATPHFRFISSTAAFLDERIWRTIESRFDTMVVNSYGLTETVMEALYCGPTDDTRLVGTIGKPVDCEARIVDTDGNDVPSGEPGELWLRGDNIMRGYFDDPELTAAAFDSGWLKTGDLATSDAAGFFRIVGRQKNLIIRAGLNIQPEDVNAALTAIDSVQSAATVGVPDEMLGEKVVSCVVPVDASAPPDPAVLMAACRTSLSAERLPNHILVVDALPLGPSGKVELVKVQTMVDRELTGTVGTSDVPRAVSDTVLAIAAAVFNEHLETLSPDASEDTTQGWDSLSYLEFVTALERNFDFRLAPRDVMNIRHLGDAVRIVEERLG